ncbi:unnamed protein product, partial [Closterium sp. Naga37s-1]
NERSSWQRFLPPACLHCCPCCLLSLPPLPLTPPFRLSRPMCLYVNRVFVCSDPRPFLL